MYFDLIRTVWIDLKMEISNIFMRRRFLTNLGAFYDVVFEIVAVVGSDPFPNIHKDARIHCCYCWLTGDWCRPVQ